MCDCERDDRIRESRLHADGNRVKARFRGHALPHPINEGSWRGGAQIEETMSGRQVVECIPNFSEGRRTDVIQAIADAIHETAGCSLLDVDSGVSNNRTVYTYVGAPTEVVQAALAAARVAFQRIDMSKHKGLY